MMPKSLAWVPPMLACAATLPSWIGAQASQAVVQVGEGVDQGGPDRLADSAYLAFAAQHPLTAPHLERHVAETGVLRAQVNHAFDIVRPVGGEERADSRLGAVFARRRAGTRPVAPR